MNVAWGARLSDETKGLDILGIRALDQGIEASLTNGITTISIRARYISILVWAIGQYFSDESADGRTKHDHQARAAYFNRVRFLVLAATSFDEHASPGVLGSDQFTSKIAALRRGEAVAMPTDGNLAILGAYFGPASALGLVESRPASSGLPFGLTVRGTEMFHDRQAALAGSNLMKLLRDGGDIDPDAARAAVPAFSLGRLGEFGREGELLRQAVEQPWAPNNAMAAKRVVLAYERLNATRTWLDQELRGQSVSANELIVRNYDRAARIGASGIEKEWASFEWHRRVHFALELLLSAVTKTLAVDGSKSVAAIVADWIANSAEDELSTDWDRPIGEVASSVDLNRFEGGLLRPADFVLDPPQQALQAMRILMTQACIASAIGIEPEGAAERLPPSARAIQLVLDGSGTLAEVLHEICDECVVKRHIANTMRKMGNNQDCSLRFYPDGPLLVPTNIDFNPAYSGSRLQNTIRILSDVGMLAPDAAASMAVAS